MKGFTLIETLIALVLLSLLLLVLLGGLHTTRQYWKTADARVEHSNDMRLSAFFLRRLVSRAVPLTGVEESGVRLLFSGTADKLSFIAPLPAHRGGGGLHVVHIELAKQGRGQAKQLQLRYRTLHSTPPKFNEAHEDDDVAVIVQDVERLALRYFGRDGKDERVRMEWKEKWEKQRQLPRLIRLEIQTKDTGAWPVMDIPLQVNIAPVTDEFLLNTLIH